MHDLAILFVSGRTQELELPSDARVGYLPKPYSQEDLAQALNELTGRSG
jgi:CheY-like chemotaxis protein